MVKLIAWNINQSAAAWRELADCGADIALLQEAQKPPDDVATRVEVDPVPWQTAGAAHRPWRTVVVRLSTGVTLSWFTPKPVAEARLDELPVSRMGTLAAALVTPTSGDPFVAVSMYGLLENPHPSAGGNWIYADASVHRVISDLSALVGRQTGHRIVAAGDLNILHGYGENGSPYWQSRYSTIFDRMAAIGLSFAGPQAPSGGRQTDPWPDELPRANSNVPTYYGTGQGPRTALRQLDFVFASHGFSHRVQARALNAIDAWGPSDHCRIEIEVA